MLKTITKKVSILAVFLTLLLVSVSAFSQTYDDFMADAKVAFEAKTYRKAIALLLKANRLKPEPKNLFRVARSYVEASDCGMAIVYFKAFLKEKNITASRKATAKQAVANASACGNYTPDLSGRLFIKSSPAGAGVSIDGKTIGITPVEIAGFIEGKHVLRFELPRHNKLTKDIILKRGADASTFAKLTPSDGQGVVEADKEKNVKEAENEEDFGIEEEETDPDLPTVEADAPRKLSVGILLGANYSQINQPTDPAGEPTLLFGTAYTGIGFTGGLTTTFNALDFGPGSLNLRLDLLGAFNKVAGFAENKTRNSRSELAFSEVSIRAPILVGYTHILNKGESSGEFPVFLFGGIDLLLASLSTASEVTPNNGNPDQVPTRGSNRLSLLAVVGTAFQTGDWVIPIDLRFNYNPFTESSTRTRFDNYVSADNTGAYQVAFDWQLFITLGVSKYLF